MAGMELMALVLVIAMLGATTATVVGTTNKETGTDVKVCLVCMEMGSTMEHHKHVTKEDTEHD